MMMEMDAGRLLRDGRWLCIQAEQCIGRRLASTGLTAAQAQILLCLLDRDGQGTLLTEIHRAFGYSMATLSSMVKRLREKGYIRVERCKEDDRRRLLFATEAARRLRPTLEATIQGVHSQLYHGFSQKELFTLDRLQRKLLQNLSALTAQHQKEESKS
ncbi:MarR family transcriptional regulator [uncultured Pseudoflavonifractor sp.]|uniref:MarR family winged helix-turn-helix transcriptional regulator n=1 Tax=uncultured Pseudoflavonifractor sp. TaxID=1221379 RepID=UPI0025D13E95|nr:MarR family transcriptional regulator [uncultured Pseudoflavonifractor sp.]